MGVQQDLVVPSGLIAEEPWEPAPQSNPWFIGIHRWNQAEKAAEGIISKFQPTIVAEGKRDAVINYLQRLLKENLDCEVFAYGSVPLKTYLPDGDIDLSAVGVNTHDLINEIASLLDREGKNNSAEFVVKDVQVIGAEVKLVKCMVQNLVVDISVNQIGGLCTLCFLEQVDRVIKKDHLFKRSIILIKAWCYFESRTLGAHVGLISTYGLETLVLYIFHVFHTSLDGPLSVLYKFLEYFSTFDWDKYGISLMGPIRLSELPRIVVERPPNSNDLLLEVGFLRHCSEKFSVPMRPGDLFYKKHLNIVDPLNDHNNLGRSVSQGNFFRIRSAFSYGARKLEQILMAPEDKLSNELLSFFSNTLNMHGSGQRPDLPDHIPRAEKSFPTSQTTRTSNDENGSPGNPKSNEEKDVSALVNEGEVAIPFYAPHLLFNYSKLVNKTEKDEIVDENESKEIEEGVNLGQSEPLDLTGDLMSHLVCLDHVRWWNTYVLGPLPPMMGPPPPPPPILLSMIASEHGGMNGVVRHPRFHHHPPPPPPPPFVPNDRRGAISYFPDTNNRSRHGYHTSTSNATNTKTGPTDFTTPTESVTRPMQQPREPLSHRRRHQNPNPNRNGSPRPRPVSGMDRFNVQSSYHLKDEEDFPPLS
ncbi:uncharacterized protein LOC111893647 isoform X1 [Lactuca sativa]|uniref:Polymerase nucleotidyl transferase domain-containing protein n=1 Tax=Lactuca sativa TaxID=4236 RepID=A0A9R1WWS1_LACSA|nr:uncharacterized protein LOC111893647 isoform X1 [Lactuca sativa]XP_023745472.1 uncharacterized protein LOC111893647 isoform X1 [Lactuca sativa]KAJ0191905.1 hypothetical protein LSAT_V11C800431290 [Lactuca sativa]